MNMADNKNVMATPLKSALIGAAVGAAAVVLSKKEVRDKISKTAKKVLDQGGQKINEALDSAERTTKKLSREMEKKV